MERKPTLMQSPPTPVNCSVTVLLPGSILDRGVWASSPTLRLTGRDTPAFAGTFTGIVAVTWSCAGRSVRRSRPIGSGPKLRPHRSPGNAARHERGSWQPPCRWTDRHVRHSIRRQWSPRLSRNPQRPPLTPQERARAPRPCSSQGHPDQTVVIGIEAAQDPDAALTGCDQAFVGLGGDGNALDDPARPGIDPHKLSRAVTAHTDQSPSQDRHRAPRQSGQRR